jgi:hypothetical protein
VIVRALSDDEWILVRQPDHAGLAADLMTPWTAGGFPENPRRDRILAATRAHDDGWQEEDAAMLVDTEGRPVDFIAAASDVKQRVWPRAIERLAAAAPYVAALVAQHALTVYGHYREDPPWASFFAWMAALRDQQLAQCEPDVAAALGPDYDIVRIGDLLSLAFCNRWDKTVEYGRYSIAIDEHGVRVTPDPFGGRPIAFRVAGRRVPRRQYRDARDLRSTLETASLVWIEGVARGAG